MRKVMQYCLPAMLIFGLQGIDSAAIPGVHPGVLVVADAEQGPRGGASSLIVIDPVTAEQSILSSGGLINVPQGMVFDRVGHRLLIVNYTTLVAVDALTGAQSLIAQLPGLIDAITVEAPGRYLLTDYNGRLLRFDEPTLDVSELASGGLIGGVSPWSVQVRHDGQIVVSSLTSGGYDVPGPPSRVIQVDPVSGLQRLILESTEVQFRDFALRGDLAWIGLSSRGQPSGADRVAKLDLTTGALTPLYSGLQRVLDVDWMRDGSLAVLDQILSLGTPVSPVVYRSTPSGLATLSSFGHMYLPQRAVVIQCFEDSDCDDSEEATADSCDLQGACRHTFDCSFATICEDHNACTEDLCDPESGCTHTSASRTVTCGVGSCQRTVDVCEGGSPRECLPGDPAAESCNGLDDDCDGRVDEDALGMDSDADGVRNLCDNCVTTPNPAQIDRDGDGFGDACDTCPTIRNPSQDPAFCDQRVADLGISLGSEVGGSSGTLAWTTLHEVDVAVYNIIEILHAGSQRRLNTGPIDCQECVTGRPATYRSIIPRHKSGRNIFIELVHADGHGELFGPAVRD